MKKLGTITIAGLCGLGLGAAAASASEGVFSVDDTALAPLKRQLAQQLVSRLPAPQRAAMMADAPGVADDEALTALVPTDERYERLRAYVSPAFFARADEEQIDRLIRILETPPGDEPPAAMCFAPDTDPEYAAAMEALLFDISPIAFQQTGRWTGTALTPGSNSQGEPATITYSFVPDGTFVPADIGLPGGSSVLFQWLNGIYGSAATWQQIFHEEFDRWGELHGVTYVFEPNDDGSATSGLPGQAGVRGDVRIGAYAFSADNDGGTLAYNNFPNDGDMIFDAFDSFYENTGGSSRRLRNTISHEHGHGLGMLHVCPADGTKLMEPFINTGFLGPQLDDVLNGQRHYGDIYEPNDSIAGPADIGSLASIGIITERDVSIDDNSDIDYYRVTITEPADLTVRAIPSAGAYDQGPQTFDCNTGAFTDYNVIHDLTVTVLTPGGSLLGFSNSTPAGQEETLVVQIATPGDYIISVNGDSTNSIQLYNLQLTTFPPPFIAASVTNTVFPTSVMPGETIDIAFDLTLNDETLVEPAVVKYRYDGGAFLEAPTTPGAGDTLTASLPQAFCADTPEYFIEFRGNLSGAVTVPEGGAADPVRVQVGVAETVFEDSFNTNLGWTVSGDATGTNDGRWERGRPLGDGTRGDPAQDADGSNAAFVTGNDSGNTDVDNLTILTSPVFDAASISGATISYARWLDNDDGSNPGTDALVVEISNNGGSSWTNLETVGPTGPEAQGGWNVVSFLVSDTITPTANMRVRFIADDSPGGASVMECGVDAFSVNGAMCMDPVGPMPCNGADLGEPLGELDIADVVAFLGFFGQGDPAADLAAPQGEFDIADVVAFLTLFGEGCPQ